MKKAANEIICFAKNCVYHSGVSDCTAAAVEVGCATACRCGETQCSTFRLDRDVKAKPQTF
ncbi:MAG: DUF1540 domain-containing protein [Clostridia bacterium]|nr:DUF1540 domain-containing protein [Clostridia bacterium]